MAPRDGAGAAGAGGVAVKVCSMAGGSVVVDVVGVVAVTGSGIPGSGAEFSLLWNTDRQAAIDYCLRDVQLTQQVADVLIPAY